MSTQVWGEVLSWSCKGLSVAYRRVVEALTDAGLDAGAAGELRPRHAFGRACRKLAGERVIRVVEENEKDVHFQFTRELKREGRFDYVLEAVLSLDKTTGRVSCDHTAAEMETLVRQAQAELDNAIAHRTGGDISRITQRLFKKQADLFPLRDAGGVYFVPQKHADFVTRVETFLTGVGGRLQRLPVAMGSASGDRCVKETVAEGMETLIQAHRQAIAELDADTRDDTFRRAAAKIQITRLKLEGYGEYISDQRERLEQALAEAQGELRKAVERITVGREEAKKAVPAEAAPV